MTDSQGGEAAVETTEGAEEAPVSSERDYEAEAKEDGWRPKDEWTGNPDKWRDAKTWVENRDLPTRIRNEVKADYEERFKKLERMTDKAVKAVKSGYEEKIAALKSERREAIKKGDDKLVDQYDDAIEKVKEAAKDDPGASTDADIEADFVKRNAWYGDDEELTALAERFSRKAAAAYHEKTGNPMPYDLNLKEVEKQVKSSALYKSKMGGKPAANGHAAVDGGSENPGGRQSRAKTFSDLPEEAKRAYAGFDPKVKAALSKEQYAKEYFEE